MIAIGDIERALDDLGMGDRVVVHASLRTLGSIDAEALLDLLERRFTTIMMPAFSFGSNAPPPPGDRPERNGTDYSFYDGWSRPPVPFVVASAEVDPKMGVLARRFAARAGTVRSDHPWHSWAAWGAGAGELVRDHDWMRANVPLERFVEQPGHVLLIGVGLSSCTAVHVAEERAGRRPFIRWATDRDGRVRRMVASGCAKGFDALTTDCEDLFTRSASFIAAPLPALVDRIAALVREAPERTRCSAGCRRCEDAIAGGPE